MYIYIYKVCETLTFRYCLPVLPDCCQPALLFAIVSQVSQSALLGKKVIKQRKKRQTTIHSVNKNINTMSFFFLIFSFQWNETTNCLLATCSSYMFSEVFFLCVSCCMVLCASMSGGKKKWNERNWLRLVDYV